MKKITNIIFNSDNKYSFFILRIITGIILSAHGSQKLFGWFGGYGLEGVGKWMDSIGLHPGYLMAFMSGSVEFFGGIALILGLFTRIAGLASSILLLVAIISVHLNNGLFLANNGFEFALALLASTITLTIEGGGKFSIDKLIKNKLGV